MIAEPHSTEETRGPNKGDEFYEQQKRFLAPSKREPKRLSGDEFWESEEPQKFHIYTVPLAQFRKFKVWIRKRLEEGMNEKSLYDRMEEKYGHLYSH